MLKCNFNYKFKKSTKIIILFIQKYDNIKLLITLPYIHTILSLICMRLTNQIPLYLLFLRIHKKTFPIFGNVFFSFTYYQHNKN